MSNVDRTFPKKYIKEQVKLLRSLDINKLEEIIHLVKCTIMNGRTIYICGNGGSFCASLHFAEDMVKCVGEALDMNVKCVALASNPGQLTCLSNDFSYNDIFSYELGQFALRGDLVIGLSVSGTSNNVINALNLARDKDMKTVLMTGNGNKPYYLYDAILEMGSDHFGRVEDATMVVLHMIVNYFVENY